MAKDNPYSPILNKVLTKQQLKEFIQLLRDAHQGLYTPKVNVQEQLEQTLPFFLAEILMLIAEKQSIPLNNTVEMQQMIDSMREYLEELPIVEIVLAFIPTYKQVKKISDWFAEYTGGHVILDIVIDENIIAGAKISSNGVYKDYSLTQWLHEKGTNDLDQFM